MNLSRFILILILEVFTWRQIMKVPLVISNSLVQMIYTLDVKSGGSIRVEGLVAGVCFLSNENSHVKIVVTTPWFFLHFLQKPGNLVYLIFVGSDSFSGNIFSEK